MKNIFTEHPRSLNETYFQHFKFAINFGLKMIIGGVACIIHAIFPFLFQTTGSDILFNTMYCLIKRMPKIEKRVELLAELIEKK